jgi:type II secretory pathway pseudopilin PulG
MDGSKPRSGGAAFTILELLIVIGIIGLLAAIALPSMKGLTKSNVMTAASRQLSDDLAYARQLALKERTVVHVIFVPRDIAMFQPSTDNTPAGLRDRKVWTNLLAHPLTSYAIFAERTVGDQPGQANPRYLTPWKSLPDGVYVADWEFVDLTAGPLQNPALWDSAPSEDRPFKFGNLVFPTSGGQVQRVPHITFDPNGSLVVKNSNGSRVVGLDEVINLAAGSIFYQRDAAGLIADYDVREAPLGNSTNNYNRIRIDGLTGRARVERPQIR